MGSGRTDASDDYIARLSPLIRRHLNFLGRYDFSLPDTVMNGGLRPLTLGGQFKPVFDTTDVGLGVTTTIPMDRLAS
jgi:hypothetical protein